MEISVLWSPDPNKWLTKYESVFWRIATMLCGGNPSALPTGPILFEFAENLYFIPGRCSQDGILTDVLNQPTFRPKFARSCYVNFVQNRVLVPLPGRPNLKIGS